MVIPVVESHNHSTLAKDGLEYVLLNHHKSAYRNSSSLNSSRSSRRSRRRTINQKSLQTCIQILFL